MKEQILYYIPHIILLVFQILFIGTAIDDAYITYHYAENLVKSGQLVWNIGEAPIEGYSTILLVLIQAVYYLLGIDLNIGTKILGILCAHLTLILLSMTSKELFEGQGYFYLPALLLAFMPPFGIHSVSGMETSLYIFLITALIYFYAKKEQNHYIVSVLLVLIVLVRLEGVVIVAPILAYNLLKNLRSLNKTFLSTIITGCVIGVYHLWRWLYFGSFLSLPTLVKRSNLVLGLFDLSGITESIQFLFRFSPYFVIALLSIIAINRAEDIHIYLLFLIATLFLVTWLFAPVMGFEYRFVFPVMVPVLLIGQKTGTDIVRWIKEINLKNLKNEKEFLQKVWKFRYLIPIIFLLLYPNLRLPNAYERVTGYSASMESNFEIAAWLIDNATDDSVVAMWDVGAVAYLTDLVVIDLAGLNDPVLAAGWNTTYVWSRNPDYIILHSDSPEEFVARTWQEQELYDHEEFNNFELVKIFYRYYRSYSYILYQRIH